MADLAFSRRQFFGTAAAVALAGQLPAPSADGSARPPLAPEPPLPPGVCQRLGSARFRELTEDFRFSPDSKWLAEFKDGQFLGYEVATGRRVKWTVPNADELQGNFQQWHLTNREVFAILFDGTNSRGCMTGRPDTSGRCSSSSYSRPATWLPRPTAAG